ncbi:MAG TPA: winged helix-turn-helix domain-containing protein, partial [Myxococcota bacterium]|nr:winged helix-turn-helix domain-containing protein [Myxococcota bacterium]
MPGRLVRSTLGVSALSFLLLSVGTCQDYAFEELPSSVIREKRIVQNISVATDIDILFVIDNSGSMVGEQVQLANSFSILTDTLDETFGEGKYQIAVITTGMESEGCPPCDAVIDQSCMNETGENGRFQSRRGRIVDPLANPPEFAFDPPDPACRIVTSANKTCFYDSATQSGIALVGTNGCGYEKGLEPIRVALSDLAGTTSAGFLRDNATLAIFVISGEEEGRLAYLAANPDCVLTHRQLLKAVWGPSHAEDSHYVRVYMGHLRKKLEASGATIATVRGL